MKLITIALILLIIFIVGFFYPDNPIEEFAEALICKCQNYKIDLSPLTPEKPEDMINMCPKEDAIEFEKYVDEYGVIWTFLKSPELKKEDQDHSQ